MQAKLIQIGNSLGVRLPKSLIRQFSLDRGNIEILAKDEGILITPVVEVPPLKEWDRLFKEAKASGFDSDDDLAEFSDWDISLSDGDE